MKKCDVLILTSAFGMGHDSVATAIREQLLKENSELNILTEDIMVVLAPKVKKVFFNLYHFLTKSHPKVYNYIYDSRKNKEVNPLDEAIYITYSKKVEKYIGGVEPQIIISTFPLCSGLVSKVKQRSGMDIPLVTSITDVVDSWEWIHKNTNMYFAPSSDVEKRLISKGVKKEQIKTTGIPVKKEFLIPREKENENRQLLIMGGAMEKLNINAELLGKLDEIENLKIVVIAGNNKELFRKLTNRTGYKNIEIMGYTTEVARLMDESDLVVTKPGGATLFEAINKEIPMILKSSNVGQEDENIKFIKDTGIGILVGENEKIENIIIRSFEDDNNLELIRSNIKKVKEGINPDKTGEYIIGLM